MTDDDQNDQDDTKTLEELTESDAISAKAIVYDPIDAGFATVDDDGKIDVGDEHAGRRVGYVLEDRDDDQGADK